MTRYIVESSGHSIGEETAIASRYISERGCQTQDGGSVSEGKLLKVNCGVTLNIANVSEFLRHIYDLPSFARVQSGVATCQYIEISVLYVKLKSFTSQYYFD